MEALGWLLPQDFSREATDDGALGLQDLTPSIMQAFWKERAVLCSLGMRAHKRACRRGGEPAGAEFCGGVLLGPVLQQGIYIYRTMNLGVEVRIRYNLIAPSVYLHSTPPLCFALMALILLHSFVAFS